MTRNIAETKKKKSENVSETFAGPDLVWVWLTMRTKRGKIPDQPTRYLGHHPLPYITHCTLLMIINIQGVFIHWYPL